MKRRAFFNLHLCCSLMVLMVLSAQVRAQSRRGGLFGDWKVKYEVGERQRESILTFSRDQEGNRTGQWISFTGLSDLKDLKYEDGRLSFSRVSRNRDGQARTSTFTGTIQDGKLSGTLSSDRGEYKVEGTPSPRLPRAVGSWEMKFKRGDREFTSTLVVKADAEGHLSALLKSERGEVEIADVQYERGNLAFKMERKSEDRQWEATFEGTIQRETDTLSGVVKSQRGETKVEGTRIGAPLIGTWNLETVSERGSRKSRLKVNPDMSGLYGSIPIKKVDLEGNHVSFDIVLEFGDQTFEMSFEGKVEDSKLTGELTSSRGSQKVTGTKVVRTFRRRGGT